MEFVLPFDIPALPHPIGYTDRIMLIGSCFTEHISQKLGQYKFEVMSNPNGILFNPLSVADSIAGYLEGRQYSEKDLFYINELWNSWDHHTRFSGTDAEQVVETINQSQAKAAGFIREAGWLIITLGTAYQYYLKEIGKAVSNNHRAPSQWFEKKMLAADEMVVELRQVLSRLLEINPGIRIIFTVSPVRHIRDGIVENNLSKARLIETAHQLCSSIPQASYFPAYELVTDVLRDYRFYEADMVHPNALAVNYVWSQFMQACISPQAQEVMHQLQDIISACQHKLRFPGTEASRKFKAAYAAKSKQLMEAFPFLDLREELAYFTQ